MHTCKRLLIVTQRVQRFKSYPEFCSCRAVRRGRTIGNVLVNGFELSVLKSVFGVDRKFDRRSFTNSNPLVARRNTWENLCRESPFKFELGFEEGEVENRRVAAAQRGETRG